MSGIALLAPATERERLRKLALFVGASDSDFSDPKEAAALIAHASCRPALDNGKRAVILYGFDGTPDESAWLAALTAGAVTTIRRCQQSSAVVKFAADAKAILGPLAGVKMSANVSEAFCAFSVDESCTQLMGIGEESLFAKVSAGAIDIFLLGARQIPDLDMPVEDGRSEFDYAPLLAPFLASLRAILGERSWVNPSPAACLILDDPLLQERYGFLNYADLLEVARRSELSTSIAFIPWNYRRTTKDAAQLFRSHPGRYSLSIHGCDHTSAEFGSRDEGVLRAKAIRARERMAEHEQLSGVPFDEVMVFPQGIFSVTAINALRACGYLAAVNSSPRPAEGLTHAFTLRELLEVVIRRFANFPIFGRRYPRDVAASAFDLFLGKPALLVEHHCYFRDGYKALIAYVDELNRLEPRLTWGSLGKICSEVCLSRRNEQGKCEVKFYTDRFIWRNQTSEGQDYVLMRPCAGRDRPSKVLNHGTECQFEVQDEWLRVELPLKAGEAFSIRMEYEGETATATRPATGTLYNTGVSLRRWLSEFRDNYLDRSVFVSRWSRKVRGLLP